MVAESVATGAGEFMISCEVNDPTSELIAELCPIAELRVDDPATAELCPIAELRVDDPATAELCPIAELRVDDPCIDEAFIVVPLIDEFFGGRGPNTAGPLSVWRFCVFGWLYDELFITEPPLYEPPVGMLACKPRFRIPISLP